MNYYKEVINELLKGDASILANPVFKMRLNKDLSEIMMSNDIADRLDMIGDILHIGNIVYNNLDLDDENQPIENGVYDILLERYRQYRVPQVGGEPVQFTNNPFHKQEVVDVMPFVTFLDPLPDPMFKDEITRPLWLTKQDLQKPFIKFGSGYGSNKKYRTVSHDNPALVGTLDKCKYVLDKQAIDKGAFNDPSVKVFERDFFAQHLMRGIFNMNTIMRLVLELKYDGLSVVVQIRNGIVTYAYSRGDTGQDKATDLTPILYGYRFYKLPKEIEIEVKCEAVMTYADLYYYNLAKGKSYKNCRSAIIGLFGSNDGYEYQDYITLVPLAIAPLNPEDDFGVMTRYEEVEFINKYLTTKELLRGVCIEGTYNYLLYMVKRFVDEAEYVRGIMPIMYDGVVVSYDDPAMREILGRENFVNKYSMAIKFNTLKKLTTLTAITYTVGQNGQITPMAHYAPVEFLGTIHMKSSIASVARFNENRFKIGNTVEVEYRNDVMPYLTTPDLDANEENPNPVLEFITECPVCGTTLEFSKSGKSAICPNIHCKGRVIPRMANMMDKLGLKDFAEASMEKLLEEYNITSLVKLFSVKEYQFIDALGEANGRKIIDRLNELYDTKIYDYTIIGALGFSNVAQETWKKILNVYTIEEIFSQWFAGSIKNMLTSIKGIGPSTAETIEAEMEIFKDDIHMIINRLPNIIYTKGMESGKSIRFSGTRDPELMEYLCSLGYDASDKSGVTKTTDILLVPSEDYTSSKVSKAGTNTLIIPIDTFKENMEYYLSM